MNEDSSTSNQAYGFYRTFAEMLDDRLRVLNLHSRKDVVEAIAKKTGIRVSENNIGNWRRGANPPTPPYLKALTTTIGIEADPEMHRLWLRLYGEATKQRRATAPPRRRPPRLSGHEKEAATAFAALDLRQLAVIGKRPSPVKVYMLMQFDECPWCRDFMGEPLARLVREHANTGEAALIFVPWWGGDWRENAGFELHYGATCLADALRSDFIRAAFRRADELLETHHRAANFVREFGRDSPDLVRLISDQERRFNIAADTLDLYKVIQGQAARLFIDGRAYGTLEEHAVSEAIRAGQPR